MKQINNKKLLGLLSLAVITAELFISGTANAQQNQCQRVITDGNWSSDYDGAKIEVRQRNCIVQIRYSSVMYKPASDLWTIDLSGKATKLPQSFIADVYRNRLSTLTQQDSYFSSITQDLLYGASITNWYMFDYNGPYNPDPQLSGKRYAIVHFTAESSNVPSLLRVIGVTSVKVLAGVKVTDKNAELRFRQLDFIGNQTLTDFSKYVWALFNIEELTKSKMFLGAQPRQP